MCKKICERCGQQVILAKTFSGIEIPFSAQPAEDGSYLLREQILIGGEVILRAIFRPPRDRKSVQGLLYIPHLQQCPLRQQGRTV